MKNFRLSELFFLLSGLVLILTAIEFMRNDISLAKLFNLHATAGDPFEAMYFFQKTDPQTAPAKLQLNPVAVTATPAPEASPLPVQVAPSTPVPTTPSPFRPKPALTPASTPRSTPMATPLPVVTTPSPLAVRVQAPAQKTAPLEVEQANIFLVSPPSQAVVTLKSTGKLPLSLKFTFEVYPAGEASHFELLMNGKPVETREIAGLPSGNYSLEIPAPASGLYQWQVKTNDKTSELRGLTVKMIH